MKHAENGIGGKAYAGAIQGLVAWTAYAAVECCFLSIIPRFRPAGFSDTPPAWRQTVLSFGLYMAIGLLLGALSGLAFGLGARRLPVLGKANAARLLSAAATFTLTWALAINLAVMSVPGPSIRVRFLVTVLLSAGVAWSAGSGLWAERLSCFLNPWSISLLLLGLPWINRQLSMRVSSAVVGGSALAYLLAVSFASWLLQRVLGAGRSGRYTEGPALLPKKTLALLGAAVAMVIGTAYALDDRANPETPKLPPTTSGAGRPNVVVVVMDTVRADHLSLYGYERETTPNLKKFAEDATIYTQAIAPSDMSLSSHASLFTGLYARRHGARYIEPNGPLNQEAGTPLAGKFRTLAEILSENGYLTMGVAANQAYLGDTFGLSQGFALHSLVGTTARAPRVREFYLRAGLAKLSKALPGSVFGGDVIHNQAEDVNRLVFPLVDRAGRSGNPFFLFVNYMDAHEPYHPPPPFDALFPGRDGTVTRDRYYKLMWHVNALTEKMTERERRHAVSQYDGGIAYIDFHLGKLFGQLQRLGLYENSLLLITSDHGEAFGDRDLVGHGGLSVYQDLVHVPLLIRYPNSHQKAVADDPVSLVDVMPTILDVLDLEIPKDIDGQSLRNMEPGIPRIVITETFPGTRLLGLHPRFRRVERALFSGSLKFIHSTAGKRELYDLSKDQNENRNLYHKEDGVSGELEARLNQWLRTIGEERSAPTKLGKDVRDRLKSLGYLQ